MLLVFCVSVDTAGLWKLEPPGPRCPLAPRRRTCVQVMFSFFRFLFFLSGRSGSPGAPALIVCTRDWKWRRAQRSEFWIREVQLSSSQPEVMLTEYNINNYVCINMFLQEPREDKQDTDSREFMFSLGCNLLFKSSSSDALISENLIDGVRN